MDDDASQERNDQVYGFIGNFESYLVIFDLGIDSQHILVELKDPFQLKDSFRSIEQDISSMIGLSFFLAGSGKPQSGQMKGILENISS